MYDLLEIAEAIHQFALATWPKTVQQTSDIGVTCSQRLRQVIADACAGLDNTDPERVYRDTLRNLFDGVAECDVCPMLVMSARALIDIEPDYSYVAARLLLDSLRTESLGFLEDGSPNATYAEMAERYPLYFAHYIKKGAELELLDTEPVVQDRPGQDQRRRRRGARGAGRPGLRRAGPLRLRALLAGAPVGIVVLGLARGIVGYIVFGALGGLLGGLVGITASNIIGQVIIATAGAALCIWLWRRMR